VSLFEATKAFKAVTDIACCANGFVWVVSKHFNYSLVKNNSSESWKK